MSDGIGLISGSLTSGFDVGRLDDVGHIKSPLFRELRRVPCSMRAAAISRLCARRGMRRLSLPRRSQVRREKDQANRNREKRPRRRGAVRRLSPAGGRCIATTDARLACLESQNMKSWNEFPARQCRRGDREYAGQIADSENDI